MSLVDLTTRNEDITRSARSYDTFKSTGSTGNDSMRLDSLHGNLMRTHAKRDPMKIYEVMDMLGEGSMGSVSRVRKRQNAKGGSSRKDFVRKNQPCWMRFLLFCPQLKQDLVTNVNKKNKNKSNKDNSNNLTNSTRSSTSFGTNNSFGAVTTDSDEPAVPATNGKIIIKKKSSIINHKNNNKDVIYALKSIHLSRVSSEEFRLELKNEVEILKNLDHPNICKAIETFDYRHQLFIVLECCTGGDLYTRDPYSEPAAQNIIASLFSALSYLHHKGIVHRDLKFENIMFVSPRSPEVKLIDFGLSKKYADGDHLHDAVGTVYTMAPELLEGDYGPKIDVWSLGVIAFMLLSSSMPFYGKDRRHVVKKIRHGKYSFASRRWRKVSDEAKKFIMELLQSDPEKRPSADEVLEHLWLSHDFETHNVDLEQEMMDKVQVALQAFGKYGKLKQLALMIVAYKSTSEEIGFLRNMFKEFDVKRDGEITYSEFKDVMTKKYDYSENEMQEMFNGIDIDGTGVVHYSEFLGATIEAHGSIDEEDLAECFDRIDCDDNGYITVENLQDLLGKDIPKTYLEKVIGEADTDRDHCISYEEFLDLWNQECDTASLSRVESHRLSRATSTASSVASVSSDMPSLHFDGVNNKTLSSTSSSGNSGTGESLFAQEKAKSVRGVWV